MDGNTKAIGGFMIWGMIMEEWSTPGKAGVGEVVDVGTWECENGSWFEFDDSCPEDDQNS